MFAESLSLIAGYGIKACLIAQDITPDSCAPTAMTRRSRRTAIRASRSGRTASKLRGCFPRWRARPRFATRTGRSPVHGASVSEPEFARPLLTPDEATRLGSSEALIFTSGQPAIRATKLRYYREPFSSDERAIQPPSKSDRVANSTTVGKAASAVTASSVSCEIKQNTKSLAQDRPAPQTNSLGKAAEPQPVAQLAFLKFAVDHATDAAAITNRGRKKERLL